MQTPTLRVHIPLEGSVRVFLDAESNEDEARLRDWVNSSEERREIVCAAARARGLEIDD